MKWARSRNLCYPSQYPQLSALPCCSKTCCSLLIFPFPVNNYQTSFLVQYLLTFGWSLGKAITRNIVTHGLLQTYLRSTRPLEGWCFFHKLKIRRGISLVTLSLISYSTIFITFTFFSSLSSLLLEHKEKPSQRSPYAHGTVISSYP